MTTERDQRLITLGTLLRDARRARRRSQQAVVGEAGISRAQLTAVENGANVSMLFLLKLARVLDLPVSVAGVPLDAQVSSARTTAALDAVQLLRVADLLGGLVDDLRGLAVEASLPESERGRLNDSLALKEFVSRHVTNEQDLQRLGEMISGTLPQTKQTTDESSARRSSRSRRRTP